MAKRFLVELVSVEAKVWSGEADMLVARTTEGELGVLGGHAPLLGQLNEPSRVRVKTGDGEETAFDVEAGFVSVTEHGVTVLAETAVPAQGPDPAAEAATNPGTGTTDAPRPDVL